MIDKRKRNERKASTVILVATVIIVAFCIIFGTIYG